jgi:4-hydroxysphinganine ceramide fatty acyl 2-hydroxylase
MPADNIPSPELTSLKESAKLDKEFLDLTKALVPQMLTKRFSKQFYLEQVHKPRFLKGPALFFNQPYLEILTRTPWFVVPLVWIPVIVLHLIEAWKDFSSSQSGLMVLVGMLVAGVFAWTLLEYAFHRFLFHMERALPAHQLAYSLHFLLHGVHHFLPMDRLRLVMPPALFVFLSVGPYYLFQALLGQKFLNPLYSGAVSAYIGYDMCHYFFHHGLSRISLVNTMKSYHMAHHYKDYNKGYGVTSILWDVIFHTTFDNSKVKLDSIKQ